MALNNEVRETLVRVYAVLNRHSVDCLLVGGTAVGFYGYQRVSGVGVINPDIKTDLDFWYRPTTENFIHLTKALIELGIEKKSLENIVFDPKRTFLKIPFQKFHTDFLPVMLGLPHYDDCKKRATKTILDGNEISILSYSDLIQNKIAVGRAIDKDDLSGLGHNH